MAHALVKPLVKDVPFSPILQLDSFSVTVVA